MSWMPVAIVAAGAWPAQSIVERRGVNEPGILQRLRAYTRNRAWGLPPRRAWHLDASRFSGVEPRDPAKKPDPLTLEKFLAEAS